MSPRLLVSCAALTVLALIGAVTVDACASSQSRLPESSGRGIVVKKPLFGVSVLSGGSGYRSARLAAGKRYGGLPVVRYFDPNTPNSWRIIRRDVGRKPVVVSFRADPAAVISGRMDHMFRHWFFHAPKKRITWWSYLPEPEDDIAKGAYSAQSYRDASAHLAKLALEAGNPNLRSTLVLMCYTLSPYSGRNWRDYYAGDAYVDVMGWDCYNDKAPQGVYEPPRDIFGAAVRLSRKLGKTWGIAETGSPLVGADDGRQRAVWLRKLGTYAVRHHAQFATYFDIRWNVDYRLKDPPSVAAWRGVIHGPQG